jgi:hypothetical protein
MNSTKLRLIQRLSWYQPLEYFNGFLFSAIALYALYAYPFKLVYSLFSGLVVMVFLLFQGAFYWKLKLQSLRGKNIDHSKQLARFTLWKKVTEYLLIAQFLLLLIHLNSAQWTFELKGVYGWTLAANLMSLLEYINYYHRQLMIDNLHDVNYLLTNQKLKVSSLRKDIIEGKI